MPHEGSARQLPAPAFVHVDVDDLWAIADCYGIDVSPAEAHAVTRDALPRLRALFSELGIHATFFAVGRDIEDPTVADLYRQLVADGHQVGNHSWSHALNFRSLSRTQLREEISQAQEILARELQVTPVGFRAPGYGYSHQLADVLADHGFAYDSSLMPGPYGGAFRWLDRRLQKTAGGSGAAGKTQYSRLRDTWNPLSPHCVAGGRLLEIPAATSPLLRLPFQAGVCMRLGPAYFHAHLRAFRLRPRLPLLFLLHAADAADFSSVRHPFFRKVKYFATPVEVKIKHLRQMLRQVQKQRTVETTESWLENS